MAPFGPLLSALLLVPLSLLGLPAGSLLPARPGERGHARTAALLGLSSGLVLYVCLGRVLPAAALGRRLAAYLLFFAGMALSFAAGHLLPDVHDPSGARGAEKLPAAWALAFHELQECLLVFVIAAHSLASGALLAGAFFLHHLPEGRAAAPRDALTAWLIASLGALLLSSLLHLAGAVGPRSALFPLACGMAVLVTLDEMLPAARRNGHHHAMMRGMIAGMALAAFVCEILLSI